MYHDIDNLSDRELVMGLMRGDALEMKRGYSAAAAVETVRRLRYNDEHPDVDFNRAELLAFAEGFAHGCHEDHERLNTPEPGAKI